MPSSTCRGLATRTSRCTDEAHSAAVCGPWRTRAVQGCSTSQPHVRRARQADGRAMGDGHFLHDVRYSATRLVVRVECLRVSSLQVRPAVRAQVGTVRRAREPKHERERGVPRFLPWFAVRHMGTVCVTVCDADRGFVLGARCAAAMSAQKIRAAGVEFCVHTISYSASIILKLCVFTHSRRAVERFVELA